MKTLLRKSPSIKKKRFFTEIEFRQGKISKRQGFPLKFNFDNFLDKARSQSVSQKIATKTLSDNVQVAKVTKKKDEKELKAKNKITTVNKPNKSNLGEFTLPVIKSEVSTASLALNDKAEDSEESGSGSGSGDDEAEEKTLPGMHGSFFLISIIVYKFNIYN